MPVITDYRLGASSRSTHEGDTDLKKSSSGSSRLSYIDLSKGIGIFFVVLVHALYSSDTGTQQWSAYAQSILLAFVMPLFFMISGALQGKKLRSKSFCDRLYLKKLATAILVPFYTLSFVFAGLNVVFLGRGQGPDVWQMLRGILIEQSNPALVPSGVLWYLFVLFVLSVTSYVAFKLMRVTGLYVLLCAGILLHILYPSTFSEINYFAFRRISQYSLFYFLTLALPSLVLNKQLGYRRWLVPTSCTCIVLAALAAIATFTNNTLANAAHSTVLLLGLYGIFPCLFLLCTASYLCNVAKGTLPIRFLIVCGASSILIYVFHMPTFLVLKKALPIVMTMPSGIAQIALLLTGGFLMPLLYGRLLAYMPRLYSVLLGRKPVSNIELR
ncbi:MAG: acyltransferase [Cyanobacteria bacterium J06650_10]